MASSNCTDDAEYLVVDASVLMDGPIAFKLCRTCYDGANKALVTPRNPGARKTQRFASCLALAAVIGISGFVGFIAAVAYVAVHP